MVEKQYRSRGCPAAPLIDVFQYKCLDCKETNWMSEASAPFCSHAPTPPLHATDNDIFFYIVTKLSVFLNYPLL